MDISVYCTHCGQHFRIDKAGAGMEVPCPECKNSIIVPISSPVYQPGDEDRSNPASHIPPTHGKSMSWLSKPRVTPLDGLPDRLLGWLAERWWGHLIFAGVFFCFAWIMCLEGNAITREFWLSQMISAMFGNWGFYVLAVLAFGFALTFIWRSIALFKEQTGDFARSGETGDYSKTKNTSNESKQPEVNIGMLTLGYILAILFPVIGFVLGLYLLFCRNRIGHFLALFVVSLFSSAVWIAVWAQLQPQPVQYWWVSWWYEIRWW